MSGDFNVNYVTSRTKVYLNNELGSAIFLYKDCLIKYLNAYLILDISKIVLEYVY